MEGRKKTEASYVAGTLAVAVRRAKVRRTFEAARRRAQVRPPKNLSDRVVGQVYLCANTNVRRPAVGGFKVGVGLVGRRTVLQKSLDRTYTDLKGLNPVRRAVAGAHRVITVFRQIFIF